MLNGRSPSNDFTCFTHSGQSVVDYCLVPGENLNMHNDFAVHSPLSLKDLLCNPFLDSLPDHALLTWSVTFPVISPGVEGLPSSPDIPGHGLGESFGQPAPKRYKVDSVPCDFFSSPNIMSRIDNLISEIDQRELSQQAIDTVYDNFSDLLQSEMGSIFPLASHPVSDDLTPTPVRFHKPWWNSVLKKLNLEKNVAEKNWRRCTGISNRSHFKEIFIKKSKLFNREKQQAKRRYWKEQQDDLVLLQSAYPKSFWEQIGKLGVANERKQRIPLEVKNPDGSICNDIQAVISKWYRNYSSLYSKVSANKNFDEDFAHLARRKVNSLENELGGFVSE